MSSAADTASPGPGPDLSSAADRLRETAKWLVATIGAIGAVVVASVNFTDLGALLDHGSTSRIIVGLAGLGIATGGVIWMLIATVRLATAGSVQLIELQQAEAEGGAGEGILRAALDILRQQRPDLNEAIDYLDRHPGELSALILELRGTRDGLARSLDQLRREQAALRATPPAPPYTSVDEGLQEALAVVGQPINGILGGFPTVGDLATTYADALADRHTALTVYWTAPEDGALLDAANNANSRYLTIDADVGATTAVASYVRLRHAFTRAQSKIIGGFVLIIVGVASFVGATTVPPQQASLTLTPTPVTAKLTPTQASLAILEARAGSTCGVRPVDVVVISKDGNDRDVIVVNQPGCKTARLTVSARELQ